MNYNFSIDSRYLNGKIYKLYSKQYPTLLYIGSTIQTLNERFGQHRINPTNDLTAKLFQCFDDVNIELVELFPCLNREQLIYREQCYIHQCVAVNGIILNKQFTYYQAPTKCPKEIVECLIKLHPEHTVSLTYILMRDYPTL